MSASMRWIAGALALGLAAGGLQGLHAQEEEAPEPGEERCACWNLDMDRIVDRAVRAAGHRARLGIGIDYEQGARRDAEGVRVTTVADDGPAEEAGLRENDVIVSVAGRSLIEPLADVDEEEDLEPDRSLPVQRLLAILAEHEPGDEVEVAYLRDGERRTTTVELDSHGPMRILSGHGPGRGFAFRAPMPPVPPRVHAPGGPGDGPRHFRFRHEPGAMGMLWRAHRHLDGLRVETLSPELGEYFGAEEGVLVLAADADATLGLRPGDVIRSVGERTVEDADDLHRILGSYEEDEEVRFRVLRSGEEREVTGTMP